jgi:VanZ family protein
MHKKSKSNNNFNKISLYLNILFVILYLGAIFYMSNQNGFTSNRYSYIFIIKFMNKLGIENYNIYFFNLIFRKSLHFLEFSILNLIIFMVVRNFVSKFKNQIYVTLTCILIFAFVDEFHQMFILGRTAKYYDIIIDFSGAVFSTTLMILFIKLKKCF